MADAVSAVTQLDGDKKLITTYTNISDSTGDATEAAYTAGKIVIKITGAAFDYNNG